MLFFALLALTQLVGLAAATITLYGSASMAGCLDNTFYWANDAAVAALPYTFYYIQSGAYVTVIVNPAKDYWPFTWNYPTNAQNPQTLGFVVRDKNGTYSNILTYTLSSNVCSSSSTTTTSSVPPTTPAIVPPTTTTTSNPMTSNPGTTTTTTSTTANNNNDNNNNNGPSSSVGTTTSPNSGTTTTSPDSNPTSTSSNAALSASGASALLASLSSAGSVVLTTSLSTSNGQVYTVTIDRTVSASGASTSNTSTSSSSSTGAIAGGVVGGLVVLIVGGIFLCLRSRNRKRAAEAASRRNLDLIEDGRAEKIHPVNPYDAYARLTPFPPPLPSSTSESAPSLGGSSGLGATGYMPVAQTDEYLNVPAVEMVSPVSEKSMSEKWESMGTSAEEVEPVAGPSRISTAMDAGFAPFIPVDVKEKQPQVDSTPVHSPMQSPVQSPIDGKSVIPDPKAPEAPVASSSEAGPSSSASTSAPATTTAAAEAEPVPQQDDAAARTSDEYDFEGATLPPDYESVIRQSIHLARTSVVGPSGAVAEPLIEQEEEGR